MSKRPDVLLLDSRDSFTFNLAQAFSEAGAGVEVKPAHEVTAAEVLALCPQLVCIGPGPRGPRDMPALVDLCRALFGRVPLFGVCLGLQALVRARGGEVGRARRPVHGKRTPIRHDGAGIFEGLFSALWVMRYHSLVATRLPDGASITARCEEGQPMALRFEAECPTHAVQFYPESVGTAGGLRLLVNALRLAGVSAREPAERPGHIPPPDDVGPGFSLPKAADLASPEAPCGEGTS